MNKRKQEYETEKWKLPVGSNSLEVRDPLSLLGFLSGGWSLLRMLLVLDEEKHPWDIGKANTNKCLNCVKLFYESSYSLWKVLVCFGFFFFLFFAGTIMASFCGTTFNIQENVRGFIHTHKKQLFMSGLEIIWWEDLLVYESCRQSVYCTTARENVEPLCWAPREREQRMDDPKERRYKARLWHEPWEAMYGCLCLYQPRQWKATVLFTVKGCDGPPSEKGPLCPSFCVCVHWGLYIWPKLWGPNCVAAHQSQ